MLRVLKYVIHPLWEDEVDLLRHILISWIGPRTGPDRTHLLHYLVFLLQTASHGDEEPDWVGGALLLQREENTEKTN